MILFNTLVKFDLPRKRLYKSWIKQIIEAENHRVGDINYIFCDDDYLLEINQQYLQHDTLTDIITFDYVENRVVSGDIYISIERIKENAAIYSVSFEEEMLRVLAHGVLHLCGYPDKSPAEAKVMREKEEWAMNLFKSTTFNCK